MDNPSQVSTEPPHRGGGTIPKKMRPERIVVGDEVFERNDLTAARYGGSERTINRGDRQGAPYRFFNGVKYRPVKRYEDYVLRGIQQFEPSPKRGRRR
jgi:hypothetical protein